MEFTLDSRVQLWKACRVLFPVSQWFVLWFVPGSWILVDFGVFLSIMLSKAWGFLVVCL